MKKMPLFLLLLAPCAFSIQQAQAHSHKTYIVEQPASTVIVQPPAQTVVVQPAPTVVVQPQAPAAYVTVESEPPADFEEEMGVCPGANYVWIKGHWRWDGFHWVRVHGHWGVRPHATAIWVSGCWTSHHHHWVWTEGYWR